MIDKEKLINYIQNNFNIDIVSYMLIDNICRIDITKKELKENNIIK